MQVCLGGHKKPVPKNPVGKKAKEIWGWPGATYVPRQDSKQINQNCNRQKQNF